MKRKIALLLTVIMLVTVILPVSIFAAEEPGLAEAIKIAKGIFNIPETFTKFNYYINTEGDRKVWSMDWSSKDDNGSTISVAVDDQKHILRYSNYMPYDYYKVKRIPGVDRKTAIQKAEEFIKKVDPEMASNIKLSDNSRNYVMDYSYYFNFTRTVNGISFPSNNVSVEVNKDTGEIRSFYTNWTYDIIFPAADKVISMDQMKKVYKEKLGLKLIYSTTNENDAVKVFPAYVPKYNGYYINALNGDRIDIQSDMYGSYYDSYARATSLKFSETQNVKGANAALSPEEIKAVNEVANLLSKEDAEEKVRAVKYFGLTDEFKLSGSNLYKDWTETDSFIWELYFNKESKDKKPDDFSSKSITINAKTGEVKRFWMDSSYNSGDKPKFNKEQSQKAAEAFLKEFAPDKFAKTVLEADNREYDYYIKMNGEEPRQYYFKYARKVGSAEFPSNWLSIRFNTVTGTIESYESNWSNTVKFPSIVKVKNASSVLETMFKEIGFELQYRAIYPDELYLKYGKPVGGASKKEAVLVYAPKPGKPVMLDANTGAVIGSDGQPFKEIKPVEYTDIAGHAAEKEIKIFAEYGITLEGNEFKPDQSITQKDFLSLLSKTTYYFEPYKSALAMTDKEVEQMYSYFIREGIIKENEKAPDSNVTREDAVKFIIRAMKMDKVADLKTIFNCTFKDKNKINPDLIGYVAIAEGFNIISGTDGNFNPADKLSRAQAVVMIYKYLMI